LGEALDLGNEPSDVIHHVVRLTYNGVLNVIDKTNISVADVTSSLNRGFKHEVQHPVSHMIF